MGNGSIVTFVESFILILGKMASLAALINYIFINSMNSFNSITMFNIKCIQANKFKLN